LKNTPEKCSIFLVVVFNQSYF